ncbi:MAG: DUF1559 domain-containing protein, partial [Candidatus Saccharimonadales bacterium]
MISVGRRAAMTLMEVLVAISIIGMLMALLMPAVQQAREAARRIQCASNIRNIALAVQGEMNAKGRLPASGNFNTNGVPFHDWVVNVLPYIERTDVIGQWRFDQPSNQPPNSPLATVAIDVLTCPDDTAAGGQARLNYLANGGFGWTEPTDCPSVRNSATGIQPFDYNGNGVVCPVDPSQDNSPFGTDKSLFFKTGLFFPENWPRGSGTVRHHTSDSIYDGLSHTILLAEKLWTLGQLGGWGDPHPVRTCFFMSSSVCESDKCSPSNVDWRRARNSSSPSSWHPGGVN